MCITIVVETGGSRGLFRLLACGLIEVGSMGVCDEGYQVIPMTRRPGGFFAQPEHCQKLLLDVGAVCVCEVVAHHERALAEESAVEGHVRSVAVLGEIAVRWCMRMVGGRV